MPTSSVYQMVRLAPNPGAPVAEYDLMIVAGGSDERAYQVLRNAKSWTLRFNRVLFCDFQERSESDNLEAREAYHRYRDLGQNVTVLTCSIRDPSACLKAISSMGLSLRSTSKVALDISSFTRPYCFALLKYLQDFCFLFSVDVFYTEPMSYVIPKGLLRSYRKSLGALSVMEVPGFPGRDTGTTKSALIVTLGFDGELSAFISDEVTPDSIILINGFPAYSTKFKDVSLINNERLLNYSGVQENIWYCRASNPFEMYNLLRSIQKRNPSTFFNVAPLGPKPMALGACMFALANNSVRIVYPMPEKYAMVTTERCWHSWRYVLPLGSALAESPSGASTTAPGARHTRRARSPSRL